MLPPTTMHHLLGKEVMVNNTPCYVVACDREIGITLHTIEDDSEYLCLNRKFLMEKMEAKDKLRQYHEAFSKNVEMIERGLVDCNMMFPRWSDERWRAIPFESCNSIGIKCAFK